jgi:hypothetical protein
LSIEQLNAIDLLVTGKTDAEVAAAVGRDRTTIWEWRNRWPFFMATLQERQAELYRTATERLRSGLGKAVETLLEAVENGNIKASIELLKCCAMYGNGAMNSLDERDPVKIAERLCLEDLAREGVSAHADLDRLITLQANPRYEQRKAELMARLLNGDSLEGEVKRGITHE